MFHPQNLRPGDVFAGDFRVEAPLAMGGMGAVYVVEQLSTGRKRALKLMHADFVRDPRARERFEQEARVGSRVSSDHVVEVVAAGVDDATGAPWLCMELLEGETLAQRVSREGRLAPNVVLEVFRQMCHALGAAHRIGLVHRDLKPENLFLERPRRDGVPFTLKILDFGIAKLAQDVNATSATNAIGSPLWMAPEQTHVGTIQPATDVWALGLIAYQLLTGRSYWRAAGDQGATLQGLLTEIMVAPLEPASVRAAQQGLSALLPGGFDDWFSRTVVREPERRFRDASEALAQLVPLLGGSPSTTFAQSSRPAVVSSAPAASAGAVVTAPTLPLEPRRSSAWLFGLIAAGVVVLGGVAVVIAAAVGLFAFSASRGAPVGPTAPSVAGADAAEAGATAPEAPAVSSQAGGSAATSTARGSSAGASTSRASTSAPTTTAPAGPDAAPPSASAEAPKAEGSATTDRRKLARAALGAKIRMCWKGNEGAQPDAGAFTVSVSWQLSPLGQASAIAVTPRDHKKFVACTVTRVSESPWGPGPSESMSISVGL